MTDHTTQENGPDSPAADNFEFEHALNQLEQLVLRFEQGVKLTRQCQQALSSAEQRVQILMEQNGQSVAYPFQDGDAG